MIAYPCSVSMSPCALLWKGLAHRDSAVPTDRSFIDLQIYLTPLLRYSGAAPVRVVW